MTDESVTPLCCDRPDSLRSLKASETRTTVAILMLDMCLVRICATLAISFETLGGDARTWYLTRLSTYILGYECLFKPDRRKSC
jgi:hypothetical protein